MLHLRPLVVLLWIGLVALAPGQARVARLAAEPIEGEVVSVGGEVLVLEIDGARQEIPLTEVLAIDFQRPATPPAEGSVRLELRNGDRLIGRVEDGNFDELKLTTGGFGPVQLLLDPIASLIALEAADGVPPATIVRQVGPEEDELLLARRGVIDRLPGELVRVGRRGPVFTSAAGEERLFPWREEGVLALHLAAFDLPPAQKGLIVQAVTRDGSELTGVLGDAREGAVSIATWAGPTVVADFRNLWRLRFQSEAFRFVSDLEPTAVRERPYLEGGPTHGLLRDRGFRPGTPLRIGERRFLKGVAAQAHTEADFAVPEGMQRFRALIGVAPLPRAGGLPGSVRLKVLVDGAPRFESGLLEAGQEAVPLSLDGLSGAKTLTLVVADGASMTAGARGVFAEALFLR